MKIFVHSTNPTEDGLIITDSKTFVKMLNNKYTGSYRYHFDILDFNTYRHLMYIYGNIPNIVVLGLINKEAYFVVDELDSMLTEYNRYLPNEYKLNN